MKLLFIAPSAYLLGGVQDWLYLITTSLRDRGHGVTVAIPDGIYHNASDYNSHYYDLKALSFKNKSGTPEGRIRSLSNFIINNPSDMIIGVNIGDIYESFRRSRVRLPNTRLVMTLHAIESDYLGDIKENSELLDAVITTNRLTQRIVREKGLIESHRVYYAPYGVKTNVTLSRETNEAQLKIAWVGRIDNEQKRTSDIRDILKNLDDLGVDYILSIAGDGPSMPHLQKDLEHWIDSKKVQLHGSLPKVDLQDFYAKNNVLLITSEWETGPIVAWEAMAAGLVVVSTRYVGCVSEGALLNGLTALLYPIGDSKEAAKQLHRLCEPELRKYISINSKKMVLERYSAEVSVEIWEQTFKSILKEPRKQKQNLSNRQLKRRAAGKLERFIGIDMSEFLRGLLKKRGYYNDPGSEWPHSLYGESDHKSLIEYAKILEKNA